MLSLKFPPYRNHARSRHGVHTWIPEPGELGRDRRPLTGVLAMSPAKYNLPENVQGIRSHVLPLPDLQNPTELQTACLLL